MALERPPEAEKVLFGSCDKLAAEPLSLRASKDRHVRTRGPAERIDEIKKKAEQRANEMYLADGGRDVPDGQHPRTHQQRMFDAAYELIMGSGNSKGDSKAPSAVHPRAMVHVGITVDPDDEKLIRAECPNGEGYLPDSVLEEYGCASVIGGTVFNTKGEPIWFGRSRRYASPAQFAALIARDQGCVLCGRDPSRCEAHREPGQPGQQPRAK